MAVKKYHMARKKEKVQSIYYFFLSTSAAGACGTGLCVLIEYDCAYFFVESVCERVCRVAVRPCLPE